MGDPRLQDASALRLRPGTTQDADLLLAWRNDPETVRFSQTRRPVGLDEHGRWLEQQLVDPATRLWIACLDDTPVGQMRVNIEASVGEISFAVAPGCRGRGYGTEMLRMLLSLIREQHGIVELRAVVHRDNVASHRAFASSGFMASGEGEFREYRWRP